MSQDEKNGVYWKNKKLLSETGQTENKIRCIIPCGAKGTLGDLIAIPKQLLFYEDHPLIWEILNNIDSQKVSEVLIITGFLAPMLEKYLETLKPEFSERFPIIWVKEEKLGLRRGNIGTVLKQVEKHRELSRFVKERFIMHYSDIVARKFDWKKLVDEHTKAAEDQKVIGTLAVSSKPTLSVGIVTHDDYAPGFLGQMFERPRKPPSPSIPGLSANMAISVFEPRIMEFVKPEDDLYGSSVPRAKKNGFKFALHEYKGDWSHVDDRVEINSANRRVFADYYW